MAIFGRPRYKARPRLVRPGERVRDADRDMRVLEGTPQERFQALLPNLPTVPRGGLRTPPTHEQAVDAAATGDRSAQRAGGFPHVGALNADDAEIVRQGGANLTTTAEREHYLTMVEEGLASGQNATGAVARAHALPADPFEGLAFDPNTDADTDSERYWDAVERYMNAPDAAAETQADADMRAAARQIMDRAEADGPGSPHADLMARLDLRRPELVTAGGRVRTPSVLDPTVDVEVDPDADVAAALAALDQIVNKHGGSSLEIAYTPAVVDQLESLGLVRKRGNNLVATDAAYDLMDQGTAPAAPSARGSRGGALPGAPAAPAVQLPPARIMRQHPKNHWVVSYRTGDVIHNERLNVAKSASEEEAMQAAIDAGWGDKVDLGQGAVLSPLADEEVSVAPGPIESIRGYDLGEGDWVQDDEGTWAQITDLEEVEPDPVNREAIMSFRLSNGNSVGIADHQHVDAVRPERVSGPHPAMSAPVSAPALLPNTVLPSGTSAPIDPADLVTILADDDRFTAMGPKEQTAVAKALGQLRTPPSLDQIDAWLDNVTRSLGNGVDVDEANRRAKYRHKTGTQGGTPVGGAPAPPAGPSPTATPQPTFPPVAVPADMAGVQALVASLKGEFAQAQSGRDYFTHDPGSADPSAEALHREETLRAIGAGIDNIVLADPNVAKLTADSDAARKAFAKSQSDADRKAYWKASGDAARAYAQATRDALAQIRPMGTGGDDTLTPNWKIEAGNTDLEGAVGTALEYYPTEWITTAGQWDLKIQSSHNGGTKAQGWFREEAPSKGQVYLSNPKKSATAVHELGHLMERNRRALAQAEWVFLHRRSKGKGIQQIPKYGTTGYTNDFMDEYIGATYLPAGVPGYRAKNFEAFTRGMEWVSGLGRMMRTSKPDPDYRAFMVGVLAVM